MGPFIESLDIPSDIDDDKLSFEVDEDENWHRTIFNFKIS